MGNKMNGIIVTVNLLGAFSTPVSNSSSRKQIRLSDKVKTNSAFIPRERQRCVRKINISAEVAKEWTLHPPKGTKEIIFKNMGKAKKIACHVATFDEGYGATFEIID